MADERLLATIDTFGLAVQRALTRTREGADGNLDDVITQLTTEVQATVEALDRPGETPVGEDPFDYYTGLINGLTADIAALRQSDVASGDRVDALEGSLNDLSTRLTADIDALRQADVDDAARMDTFDASLTGFRQDFVKQTGPLDRTPGRLMTTGSGGIGGILELRNSIAVTGLPSDLYRWGTIFGFAEATALGLTSLPANTYGELKVVNQWTDASGRASIHREFTSLGRKFIQFALNETTWSPWRELFNTGNVVGTVSSQADGVPTGAIIERGSNSNGQYVRYADGTQICMYEYPGAILTSSSWGSLFISGILYPNFPAAFVGVPIVNVSARWPGNASTSLAWGTEQAVTQTSLALYLLSGTSTGSGYPGYVAIGRWR